MKKAIILALVAILVGLTACTPTAPGNTIKATGMTLKSEKERNESPEVASSDISSLTDGNGVFTFNLYKLVSIGHDVCWRSWRYREADGRYPSISPITRTTAPSL